MNPSMKITSDRHTQRYFNLVGNAWSSLKSCSCMAVEKSRSMCVRFGHLLANSCSTVCVMSSMGSSMYRNEAPNLTLYARIDLVKKIITTGSAPRPGISIFFYIFLRTNFKIFHRIWGRERKKNFKFIMISLSIVGFVSFFRPKKSCLFHMNFMAGKSQFTKKKVQITGYCAEPSFSSKA